MKSDEHVPEKSSIAVGYEDMPVILPIFSRLQTICWNAPTDKCQTITPLASGSLHIPCSLGRQTCENFTCVDATAGKSFELAEPSRDFVSCWLLLIGAISAMTQWRRMGKEEGQVECLRTPFVGTIPTSSNFEA